jgi:hypothetical protein
VATRAAAVAHGGADGLIAGAVGTGGFNTADALAVFILLAFGLFPFLYSVVVSLQKPPSLLDQYTDFQVS